MTEELLSKLGAQDKDTNGYQLSDLDDVDFYWENDQLDVVAVFRPGNETPFPLQLLTILRWVQWMKTQPGLTKSKTRRILLLIQKLKSPRDQTNSLC